MEKLCQKDQLINYLERQIADIGDIQQKLRDFKHGQIEILVALNASIESGDKEVVKKLLHQYRIRVDEIIKLEPKFPYVSNLVGSELMAVRHLILDKANFAQTEGVRLTAEIPAEINHIPMPILDLVDILGVWLNNAIEEAVHTKEKFVHVSFIMDKDNDQDMLVVRVSNSSRLCVIDAHTLNQQGVSSKGEDRGSGLRIVQDKLMVHDNIHIKTQVMDHKFVQILEIIC